MFTYTITTVCPKYGEHKHVVTDHAAATALLQDMMFSGRRGATVTVEIK